jgi:hypothetical protein
MKSLPSTTNFIPLSLLTTDTLFDCEKLMLLVKIILILSFHIIILFFFYIDSLKRRQKYFN